MPMTRRTGYPFESGLLWGKREQGFYQGVNGGVPGGGVVDVPVIFAHATPRGVATPAVTYNDLPVVNIGSDRFSIWVNVPAASAGAELQALAWTTPDVLGGGLPAATLHFPMAAIGQYSTSAALGLALVFAGAVAFVLRELILPFPYVAWRFVNGPVAQPGAFALSVTGGV